MKIRTSTFVLPDGREILLRSPTPEDAAQMIAYLKRTCAETHFLSREPEECNFTLDEERLVLRAQLQAEREFMLAAELDGRIIGNCGVNIRQNGMRMQHRAGIGIAVEKAFWGLGLGRALFSRALKQAEDNGFSQIELGLFADNTRARLLYEAFGFQEMGRIPNAFRLKDGSFCDEIQMVKIL